MNDPLRVANMSGFYGDRLSAAREMVRGGPIDVLTGDYLAELTLAILHRTRQKDPSKGYATTFLRQMEEVLGECLDRKIRVVANAGGLNPRGLAADLGRVAARLGLTPKIAVVDGDDLLPRLADLDREGEALAHLDRGTALGAAVSRAVTANAYLGGWGIKEALDRGADVVITGRVADAALVVGPAASRFGWRRDDWDRLAGAVAAGHILECGAQATGGNYSFFEEIPSLRDVGFPIAEVFADGSFVITKHPGTGGLVSTGTVTAQLLYEIAGPRYVTPDVIARFDSLSLREDGPDRVRVEGARGEPAPRTAKIAVNLDGGFRSAVTLLIAGLDVDRKAELVEDALFHALGGRDQFDRVESSLRRRPPLDPASNEEAIAELRLTVTSQDAARVGRRFSAAVVELMLSTVPGVTGTAPPGDATPFVTYWPALVDVRHLREVVAIDGEEIAVEPAPASPASAIAVATETAAAPTIATEIATAPEAFSLESATVLVPLGRLFGARSGDKGSHATLGVWARTPEEYGFLRSFLTIDKLADLIPEAASSPIERHELPNLLALSFVIRGLLGDGVAGSSRVDPQAKTLAEYLRARHIEAPAILLTTPGA